MSPLTVAALVFSGYLVGMATGIRYCLKTRFAVVLNLRRPIIPREPRLPAEFREAFRNQLPTLTGLAVTREVGQLARECRPREEIP